MSEPLDRNGFRITNKTFASPQDAGSLDPVTKRSVTICNLFSNHRLSPADIVRILDEEYKHVVGILIAEGLIYDRRRTPRDTPKVESASSRFNRRPQRW